jgi:hypothetical protein
MFEFQMVELARGCTRDNPLLRPSMRSIVVALMTLSSPTEDCYYDTSYENQSLINILSVRWRFCVPNWMMFVKTTWNIHSYGEFFYLEFKFHFLKYSKSPRSQEDML